MFKHTAIMFWNIFSAICLSLDPQSIAFPMFRVKVILWSRGIIIFMYWEKGSHIVGQFKKNWKDVIELVITYHDVFYLYFQFYDSIGFSKIYFLFSLKMRYCNFPQSLSSSSCMCHKYFLFKYSQNLRHVVQMLDAQKHLWKR